MSGLIGPKKVAMPVVEPPKPTIVDTTEQVQSEESRRRKRRGMASQILAGNSNKNTLGA